MLEHGGEEDSVAGGRLHVVPRASVSKAAGSSLEIEGAVFNIELSTILGVGGGGQRVAVLLGGLCTYCTHVSNV